MSAYVRKAYVSIRLIAEDELDLKRHDDCVRAFAETGAVRELNAHNLGAVKHADAALRRYSASVFVLLYWVLGFLVQTLRTNTCTDVQILTQKPLRLDLRQYLYFCTSICS